MLFAVQPLPLAGLVQAAPDVTVDPAPFTQLVGSAVGAFLTTLVVGAILVAMVPEYTERTMADVREHPIGAFVYGIVAIVVLGLVTILLAITLIGLLVAVPLALVTYLVWAVGAAVAFLAVGDRLVGHEDGWTKPLLVGAGLNGALTLTGIGGLVALGIGAAGFGAVLRSAVS